MDVTPLGTVRLVRPLLTNARLPIVRRLDGMVSVVIAPHPSKAEAPIDVTESGSGIDDRLEQL